MSKTKEQISFLEDVRADFETFISQRKWDDARAVIDNLGDLGYATEALFLHQSLNRAKDAVIRPIHESFIAGIEESDEDEEPGDIRDYHDSIGL